MVIRLRIGDDIWRITYSGRAPSWVPRRGRERTLGICHWSGRRIWVRTTLSPSVDARTLAHELAHAIHCYALDASDMLRATTTERACEAIADGMSAPLLSLLSCSALEPLLADIYSRNPTEI